MVYETQIANAAIKADMEHRLYEDVGGGTFEKKRGFDPAWPGESTHVAVATFTARDGSTSIEIECTCGSVDHEPNALKSDVVELANLQHDVFDYWPGAIDDVFSRWRHEVPQGMSFSVGASMASSAASEVSTGVSVDDDGSRYTPGNPRLASDLSNLEERTKQLVGRYASTFSDSYVTPLAPVLERQRSLAAIIEIALRAEEEIWDRTHADVIEIMQHSVEAMKASAPRSGGWGDWKVLLTVVGAVAAGVATFGTGTVAVAASLTATGTGVIKSFLNEPPEPDPPDIPLGADDPHTVLENIDNALNGAEESLSASIRTQEEHLQEILVAANDVATGSDKGMFDLPPPKIATAPPGEVLDQEQSVIVTPEIIAKITCLWIPTVVADLRLAMRLLPWESTEAWQRPSDIGLGSIGPQPEYLALQETVIGYLRNTARELEDAGQSLSDAARIIGLSDQEANREFRQKAREINESNQNYVT